MKNEWEKVMTDQACARDLWEAGWYNSEAEVAPLLRF